MARPDRFSFHLGRFLSVAAAVFVLTMFHGFYRTYCLLPPIYRATAQIAVLSPVSGSTIESDVQVMRTADVLATVVHDLQLDRIWAKRVYKSGLDALPMQDALGYFLDSLELRSQPGTNIIRIEYSSEVPKEAADVANAIADRYEVYRWVQKDESRGHLLDALRAEVDEQKKIIVDKTAGLDAARAELARKGIVVGPGLAGLVAAGQGNATALAPLFDLQHQIDQQQTVLDALNVHIGDVMADGRADARPVHIIERAEPPEYPYLPNHASDLRDAAIEGVVFAIVAAILVELVLLVLPSAEPRKIFHEVDTQPSARY